MITDPTEMLARKIAQSPTGRRCHSCLDHVMVMRCNGDTLILNAYPSDDGVYSIRADCRSVNRTESGPSRYQIHRCEGDRRMTYTDEQIEAAAKAIYGDDYDWAHELSDENEPYTTEDGDAGLVTGKNWYRRAARAALEDDTAAWVTETSALLIDAWDTFQDHLPEGEYEGLGDLRLAVARFRVLRAAVNAAQQ